MKEIKKIAIANRGEVACRIHKTCQNMGIKTVLLHSEPDIKTRAYRMCDETYLIGPGPASESYLNIDRQINAALESGADAIHPGFGFLSENSEFARKTIEAGLIFIGPGPDIILSFGDKKMAKDLCEQAEVPTVPGFRSAGSISAKDLAKKAADIGFPVIVKAVAGGGGRGMRIIQSETEALSQIESAMNEAQKSFGNAEVFLEKYLDRAKHIEVQIFGDKDGKIHVLGERECSVQRKHQKIIEETPSPSLDENQRRLVLSYAKKIAEVGHYSNAGTVEFLFQDEKFYFLEVNTRLQVEHTVTEEVYKIDLVQAQILTSQGKAVPFPVNMKPKGYSIELRLYAENPYENGTPSTGIAGSLLFPKAPGRRFEYGIEKNDEISPYYDSMLAKIISTQETRIDAISDLVKTLKTSDFFGFYTNAPELIKILNHSEFILGHMTTAFYGEHFSLPLKTSLPIEQRNHLEKVILKEIKTFSKLSSIHPWGQNWRNNALYKNLNIDLSKIKYEQVGPNIWWKHDNDVYKTLINKGSIETKVGDKKILSPMPGAIYKILCKEGQKIEAGTPLIILEAMKMEHTLKASVDGIIDKIYFKVGENVQSDDLLIDITEPR